MAVQNKLIKKDNDLTCCYCESPNLELRDRMIVKQRREGKDVCKIMLRYKTQDIFWCSICERHCVAFKDNSSRV